jgi:gephyrin
MVNAFFIKKKKKKNITHSISLDPRPEYHRVQIIVSPTEGLTATSTGKQQSSRLLSMLEANGLLQLPQLTEDKKEMKAGEIVPCIVIGPLHPAI